MLQLINKQFTEFYVFNYGDDTSRNIIFYYFDFK